MPAFEPVGIRFWRRVNRTRDCWLWTGRKIRNSGYGHFDWSHAEPILAHRAAWTLRFGAIPEGLNVLHKCDVRLCVNPSHLFVGTQSENMLDAFKKGRIRRDGEFNPHHHNYQKGVKRAALS